MNGIAGLLTQLLPRLPTDASTARSEGETFGNGKPSDDTGFDAVLSGLGQTPAADGPTGSTAMPRASLALAASNSARLAKTADASPETSPTTDTGASALAKVVAAIADGPAAAAPDSGSLQAFTNAAAESPLANPANSGAGQTVQTTVKGMSAEGSDSMLQSAPRALSSASQATTSQATTSQAVAQAATAASAAVAAAAATLDAGQAVGGDTQPSSPSVVGSASPSRAAKASSDSESAAPSAASMADGSTQAAAAATTQSMQALAAAAIVAALPQPAVSSPTTGTPTPTSKYGRTETAARTAALPAATSAASAASDAAASPTNSDGSILAPAFVTDVAVPQLPATETLSARMSDTQQPPLSAAVLVDTTAATTASSDAVAETASTNAPSAAAAAAHMKLSALSSATHFAPVARLSPIQQITDAVVGALPTLSPAASDATAAGGSDAGGVASGASADPTAMASAVSGDVVKVLNLQLEPESLGTVTVTLNLSDAGLDVQMAASQQSTLTLIDRDKGALSEQLRDSGYSVAGVAVSLGAQPASTASNDGSAAQGQSGQTFTQGDSQAMSQGGSSNANGNAQNEPDRSWLDARGSTADVSVAVEPGGSAAAGALYI